MMVLINLSYALLWILALVSAAVCFVLFQLFLGYFRMRELYAPQRPPEEAARRSEFLVSTGAVTTDAGAIKDEVGDS